jgi:acyl-CoA thioester hydrolase
MPYSHPIEVRFRDVDALGHVNNAVVVTYLEVARFGWWQGFLRGRPFEDEGFLIARIEVDYRRPILITDSIRVEVRCPRIGNSSFDIHSRVVGADGTLFAEGRSVQVVLAPGMGRPEPIRPGTRAWLETQA